MDLRNREQFYFGFSFGFAGYFYGPEGFVEVE